MKRCIITGGICSGKTYVLGAIHQFVRNAHIFSSDEFVRGLYEQTSFLKILSAEFGPKCIGSSGGVDRDWFRQHVIPIADMRRRLEELVHKSVFNAIYNEERQALNEAKKVFVAEVPLLYETHLTISTDLVIVVAASESLQVKRMMEDRELDERSIYAFLNAQLPIEAKASRADIVIWNDGDFAALESQSQLLVNYLRIE